VCRRINDGEKRLALTGRPSVTITVTPPNLPLTNETVAAFYEWLFAPWVKELGLRDFDVAPGRVVATLPQDRKLQFASGAICGQVIMSAVDTVVSLAMATTDRAPKGTTYQHTHFLRPAMTHDMRVEANVLRFGKASAFAEAKVTFASTGELVAHATLEFAF
jgi:acyl-coenzyme A thioesterase PaaI-like protein